ncbi:tRNA pseudouridine synthase A [Trifolium pratense]|uniref:tRNA pseudouridine synthase A n=1 Tax=Trifolium pratense TaxID=57577 RepID=A0A2K3MDU7_TRIPR|nr:tRNA pseudouridine synthase A [Trifolium pratense]
MATQLSDVNYVTTLQARVKELEAENANLLSQLAHCQCSKKVTELEKSKRKSEEKIEKKPGPVWEGGLGGEEKGGGLIFLF